MGTLIFYGVMGYSAGMLIPGLILAIVFQNPWWTHACGALGLVFGILVCVFDLFGFGPSGSPLRPSSDPRDSSY